MKITHNTEAIQEINEHIRDGINRWADIMLQADADEWSVALNYFPRDIFNATFILHHICQNVGIKAGRIDEARAEEYGTRLRQLVRDMTGYDVADLDAILQPQDRNLHNN